MAERIKGITVEINGDTTGLGKALKNVNSNIASTQAELKKVERLLKMDPTNTELLAQKQQLLAKRAEETAEKYETLKKALDQATDLGEEQMRALQRETIEAGEQAKKAAKEFENFNPVLERISTKAEKLSGTFGKVADKTRGLSTAAAGGVVALGGLAVNAAKSADDLVTLSKQSGFSTDTLQRWGYAADLVDVSVDDIVSSARKLKKNMGSTSEDVVGVWERLGVEVKKTDGTFRSVEDVFADTLRGLSGIADEVERDQVAMTLFGKSADDLAGIVDDGGAALKELGDEAERAGLILSGDTLAKANEFNDEMDRLKATAAASFAEAGSTLAETLLPEMEKAAAAVADLLKWFGSLNAGQLRFIGTVLMVVAAISPMARLLQSVTSIVGTTSKALQGMGTVMSFLAANPVVLVVAAIAALVAGIVLLYNKSETFRNAVLAIKDAIVKGVGDAVNFLKNLPAQALQWGRDFIDGFVKGITASVSKVTGAVSDVAGKVRSFLHFSRPDVGPLRDYETWMPDFVKGLAESLKSSQGILSGALASMAGGMEASFAPMVGAGYKGETTVRHTFDTIRVEGVSDSGQFVAAAEYSVEEVLTDMLRRQNRL